MNDNQQLELVLHISDLLYKYLCQEINDDELTALHTWAYADPANKELFEELSNPSVLSKFFRSFLEMISRHHLTDMGLACQ
jgi:hypothetical protein